MDGKEQSIIASAKQARRPLPDRIANKPILKVGLQFYFNAFYDLSGERTISEGGVGHLTWSLLVKYADHYSLGFEETEDFIDIIRRMDHVYVAHMGKKYGSKRHSKSN